MPRRWVDTISCADIEPTLMLTGLSTILTGLILLLPEPLFDHYPATFLMLQQIASENQWGLLLILVGSGKLLGVRSHNTLISMVCCAIATILWWGMTGGILFMHQVIPLLGLSLTAGVSNCWMYLRLMEERNREARIRAHRKRGDWRGGAAAYDDYRGP